MLAAAALLLSVAASAEPLEAYARATPWTALDTEDGVALARREVPGSALFEYRAVGASDVPLEPLCALVFEWAAGTREQQDLKSRKVLEGNGDERLTWDTIDEPIVASRDFGLRFRRFRDEAGACRIRFFTDNAAVPPSPRGFVRIEKLWGEWKFEPRADGKVQVTYTMFADPAGAIPPFLSNGSQRTRTRSTLLKGVRLARAEHQRAQAAAAREVTR